MNASPDASRQLRCPAALCGVFVAEAQDRIPDYVRAMYEAYWHDLRENPATPDLGTFQADFVRWSERRRNEVQTEEQIFELLGLLFD